MGGDLVVASGQYLVGDESNLNPRRSGYWLANLHTNYQLSKDIEVFRLVRNVFDRRYYTFGTFFEPEENPLFGLTVPRTVSPGAPRAFYAGVRGKLYSGDGHWGSRRAPGLSWRQALGPETVTKRRRGGGNQTARQNLKCAVADGGKSLFGSHRPRLREVAMEWRNERVCDVLNLILGAVLFFSPWIFGFASGAPSQNAMICGIIIAVLSIAALAAFAEWEEWLNLVVGLWVLVSPWVLDFAGTTAMWVHIMIGAIVAVVAAIEIWMTHRAGRVIASR